MAGAAKKEMRRQARMQRREQEEASRRQRRRVRLVGAAGGAVVVAAVLAFLALRPASSPSGPAAPAGSPAASAEQTGGASTGQAGGASTGQTGGAPAARAPEIVSVPDQGRAHVAPGESHPPYNSNPPSSGWHYGATAPWGFHNGELPDELLIHNLEHGGIWITYKDDQDAAIVDPLVALAREFPRKLVITHRPKNDSPIAVVAWGRVMKLDRFDREAIVGFYNRFKNKGPEFVPD